MSYSRIQQAEDTPFNSSGSSLSSVNAESAIKEVNVKVDQILDPATFPMAIDIHSGIKEIIDGEEITIKSRKQMIVFGELKLDGTLNLEGDLWLS